MNFLEDLEKLRIRCLLRRLVKKTQRRISEFAVQTATQYSGMMVTTPALRIIICEESKLFCQGDQCVVMAKN